MEKMNVNANIDRASTAACAAAPTRRSLPQLKFISYLQVIGVALVVLGHSFHQCPDGVLGHTLLVYRLFENVRMPLFAFISGFLLYYTMFGKRVPPFDLVGFVKNKFMRLLVPLIVVTVVTFVPRVLLSNLADDVMTLGWREFTMAFFYPKHMVIPYYWFLQMVFVCTIALYVLLWAARWLRIPHEVMLWCLFAVTAVLPLLDIDVPLFFSLYKVVRLSVFFVAGCIYCRHYEAVNRVLRVDSPIVFALMFSVWAALVLTFEHSPLIYFNSFLGILSLISVSIVIERRGIRVLDHLVGASSVIYLLSWFVHVSSQQMLAKVVTMPWLCFTSISFFGAMYLPLMVYRWMHRRGASSVVARMAAFALGEKLKR